MVTVPDIRLDFGKHDNVLLSEVPSDYLEFLSRGAKGYTITSSLDWRLMAAQELELRKLVKEGSVAARQREIPDKGPVAVGPMPLSLHAVDDAARLMLELFILRSEKKDSFTAWLKKVAQAAVEHGTVLKLLSEPGRKQITAIQYVGRVFWFEAQTLTGIQTDDELGKEGDSTPAAPSPTKGAGTGDDHDRSAAHDLFV